MLGDTVIDIEIDGWMIEPEHYAWALIEYLQQNHPVLHGRYLSRESMEGRHYPAFLRATGLAARPWRTISTALSKITIRQPREFRGPLGRMWKRKTVTMFLIPAPQKEKARLEPGF